VVVQPANGELSPVGRWQAAWLRKRSRGESADWVVAFQDEVARTYGNGEDFDQVGFIEAFLRAAQGYDDDLPTHYPRANQEPHADGKNYEWFVSNAKGQRRPLGDLATDRGFRYVERQR
jgi:hypothetical protein